MRARTATLPSQLSPEQKKLKMMVHVWLIRAGVLKDGTEREFVDFATSLVIEKYVPLMQKTLTRTAPPAPAAEPRKRNPKRKSAIIG